MGVWLRLTNKNTRTHSTHTRNVYTYLETNKLIRSRRNEHTLRYTCTHHCCSDSFSALTRCCQFCCSATKLD